MEQMGQDNQLVGNQREDNQKEDNQKVDNQKVGNQKVGNLVEAGSHVQEGTLDGEGMPLLEVEGMPHVGNHEQLELPHGQGVRTTLCHHGPCPFHLPL